MSENRDFNTISVYLEDREEQSSMLDFLNMIVDDLEGAAQGIARQALDPTRGLNSLSDAQKDTLVRHGFMPHWVSNCARCSMEVPACEMTGAYLTGNCSYCDHMISKDD